MNLNKAFIIGNLTKYVEIKALPSGTKVAIFSLATNRTYKINDDKKEEVEYHNIIAFGKTAETIYTYCKKGDNLFVEGRIQTRNWEKDDIKHYKTEIVVENFQFGKKAKREELPETTEVKITSPSEDYPNGIPLDEVPF